MFRNYLRIINDERIDTHMNASGRAVLERIINREDKIKARRCLQAAIAEFKLGGDGNRHLECDDILSWKGSEFADNDPFGMYWGVPSAVHLYAKYKSLLSATNKNAIENILLGFYYVCGWSAVNGDGRCERMYLSENHDSLIKSSMLIITEQLYDKLIEPLKGRDRDTVKKLLYTNVDSTFDSILKDGWLIEGGEPYNAVTIEGIYNIMELSEDEKLRNKAKKIVDLFWLIHVQENINGVRGYARARVYPDWRDNRSAWVSSLFGIYTGLYGATDAGEIDYLVSCDYELPKAVSDILENKEKKMPYTVETMHRGAGYYVLERHREDEEGLPTTPIYYLDNYSKILKTTYMTKDYTVSGFAYPLRMPKTLVASQFVWEGITYKEPKGLSVCAAIYETGGAYFDSFVAMHHKNRIIYAQNPNATAHLPGDNGVEIIGTDNPRYNYNMEICISGAVCEMQKEYINKNLLLFTSGGCMFSAQTDEGFTEADSKVLVNSKRLILTAGSLNDETKEEFVGRIKAQKNIFTQDCIVSCDGEDTMEFNYKNDSSYIRVINNKPVDLRSDDYIKSPFINSKMGSGVFYIGTEGKQEVIQ